MPRKLQSCLPVLGGAIASIPSTFLGTGLIPSGAVFVFVVLIGVGQEFIVWCFMERSHNELAVSLIFIQGVSLALAFFNQVEIFRNLLFESFKHFRTTLFHIVFKIIKKNSLFFKSSTLLFD